MLSSGRGQARKRGTGRLAWGGLASAGMREGGVGGAAPVRTTGCVDGQGVAAEG